MATRYDLGWREHEVEASPTGNYVKHMDYAALETRLLALLDHPVMKAHTEALREAQITGLAFIRVNANGHVQALPSDRVRISVIQAVEERTAAAAHPECDHLWHQHLGEPEFRECIRCGRVEDVCE